MKQVALGLSRLVQEIDLLASSPLVRARQTADILADAYGGIAIATVPALSPGQPPSALAQWLESEAARDVIAIVGHEPSLSTAVSWLLAGGDRVFLELKKGGACLLDLPQRVGAACATLAWLMAPRHLRALAD
jgi:phosphohistidine phosphatase